MNISTKQFFMLMALSGVMYAATLPMDTVIPMQEITNRRRLANISNRTMQDITEGRRRVKESRSSKIQKPTSKKKKPTSKKKKHGESAWRYEYTSGSPKKSVTKTTIFPDGTKRNKQQPARYSKFDMTTIE